MPQLASPSRYSVVRIVLGLAVLLVVLSNFRLARTLLNQDAVPPPRSSSRGVRIGPPLPYPVFVVGLPKVGTTSIHQMFQCSGIRSSHYCCCGSNRTHTHCNDIPSGASMAVCMKDNFKANRSILEGCGSYDVYAQMDSEFGNSMFLPQRFQMDQLHAYAPTATLVLNLRPAPDWVKSVTNWYGLGGRFLTRFKIDHRKVADRHQVLEEIYNNHSQFIRDFVRQHPSHPLVEVDITSESAGQVLADAFGLQESCWGIHNQNKKRAEGGRQKKNMRPP